MSVQMCERTLRQTARVGERHERARESQQRWRRCRSRKSEGRALNRHCAPSRSRISARAHERVQQRRETGREKWPHSVQTVTVAAGVSMRQHGAISPSMMTAGANDSTGVSPDATWISSTSGNDENAEQGILWAHNSLGRVVHHFVVCAPIVVLDVLVCCVWF